MTVLDAPASVTYRASIEGGREVELHVSLAPSSATVADAWARLSAAYSAVDPRSLEIEVRR